MAKRKKEFVNLRRYSAVRIFAKMFGSGFLIVFFMALIVILIEGYVEKTKLGVTFDSYTFFLTLVLLIFVGIGGFFFGWGIKDIRDWIIYAITRKKGVETVGVIIDSKIVSKGGYTNRSGHHFPGIFYYSITFEYESDGERKVAKTDSIYLGTEYNYLLTLPQVKIKVRKANAVVIERFNRELYHK